MFVFGGYYYFLEGVEVEGFFLGRGEVSMGTPVVIIPRTSNLYNCRIAATS